MLHALDTILLHFKRLETLLGVLLLSYLLTGTDIDVLHITCYVVKGPLFVLSIWVVNHFIFRLQI